MFSVYPTFEYITKKQSRILSSTEDEWICDGGYRERGNSLVKIDKSDYTENILYGVEELDFTFGIEQQSGNLYYIDKNGTLVKYDYSKSEDVFETGAHYAYSKAIRDGKVYCALSKRTDDATIYIYNLKGKLLEQIDVNDIEKADGSSTYFYTESNNQSRYPKTRFFITKDESIVFYDNNTKTFRKISKNESN